MFYQSLRTCQHPKLQNVFDADELAVWAHRAAGSPASGVNIENSFYEIKRGMARKGKMGAQS